MLSTSSLADDPDSPCDVSLPLADCLLPGGKKDSQERGTTAHCERQADGQEKPGSKKQEIISGHVYMWVLTKRAILETIHNTFLSVDKCFGEKLTGN